MKYKTLIKKMNLQESDFLTIKDTISKVESKTTGEIAIAVAPESAHYSFWELLISNFLAAVVMIALIPFTKKIHSLYEMIYWQQEPSWILPLFFMISCFASIAIFFYLTNIPSIDRFIIPEKVKFSCVTHRAFRYFTESGIYNTKEHTGILIFVSFMERQVRIIADQGIAQKISQDMWNLITDELAENLKKGETTTAFTTAIEKCGELLAENFPNHEENPNEFPDGLVILEDAEWY